MTIGKALNIVLVGDPKVGKSVLISKCHEINPTFGKDGFFTQKFEFPTTYKQTSLRSYHTDIHLVKLYDFGLWTYGVFQTNLIDTGGASRYDHVRPLAYMNCDVFLLCFDLTDRGSFASVQSKWLPEIKKYEPNAPIMLIGTKADLKTERQVTGSEASMLSKTLGLDRYYEISCFDDANVSPMFTVAVEVAHAGRQKSLPSKSNKSADSAPKQGYDVTNLEPASDPPEHIKSSSTFSKDWQETLNSGNLTDVILRFPDGSPDVHAHTFVLSLASGAFKKLLRNISTEVTILKSSSLPNITEEPVTRCKKCCRNSKSYILEPDMLLNNLPFTQVQLEEHLFKKITKATGNRGKVFLCEEESHKLQITFKASINYAAFSCILKWIHTGLLDISEETEESFAEHLYKTVLELEIHPLEVICYRFLKQKRKAKALTQKQVANAPLSGGCGTQVSEILEPSIELPPADATNDQEQSTSNDGDKSCHVLPSDTIVPTPPSLHLFENYLNESKNRHNSLTTNQVQSTTETPEAVSKSQSFNVYQEMWRNADKLLVNDDKLTDTVLLVEDKTIHVHRVVMVTRSPVLAAMLDGKFIEKEYSEIRLPDIPMDHFHTVLEFLYTDKCLLDETNVYDILELADRLVIQSLVDRCEEFLIYVYTFNNDLITHPYGQVGSVMDTIYFSKTYNALSLHKWCLHFIATNYKLFEGEKDFKTVWNENKIYMENSLWPPREHLQALDKYKTKTRQQKVISNVSKKLNISKNCMCCVM